MEQIVIVVPGIMGSELHLDGNVIWPGSAWSLVGPYKKMAELMREDLEAADLIRSFGPADQYSTLLDDLATCGFSEKAKPPTLYPFPYDWRRSNVKAAQGLADVVDRARKEHEGDLQIAIVAHSMGGLVSRFYLESGEFNARPGFSCVRSLVTIGTPHRGAGLALTAALGKEKRLFLSASQVLQLASDPRYPSTYELLPPPKDPFVWGPEDTRFQPLDIFDKGPAKLLGLIDANLQASESFWAKLDLAKRPAHVRYFAFYGTRQTTTTVVKVSRMGTRLDGTAWSMEDAGDGTVPSWSGQLLGMQGQPVGGKHATLFRSGELRSTLAVLLGVPGVLAPAFRVELSVVPEVVEPENVAHVSIVFPDGVQNVDGTLSLERVTKDATGNTSKESMPGEPARIRYNGAPIDKIGTTITVPEYPGFYEILFQDKQAEVEARDEVIVQASEG